MLRYGSKGRDPGLLSSIPPASGTRRTSSVTRAIPDKLFDRHRASGRLGPLLAWAVVFADIGTSIYYVPGILFVELGGKSPSPAAPLMLATGFVFILLALKYVEVSGRYPDGGGVVSVASDAFGPLAGCLGGILISVDYFLTGAISSVSGFQYLSAAIPALQALAGPLRLRGDGAARGPQHRRDPRVGHPDRRPGHRLPGGEPDRPDRGRGAAGRRRPGAWWSSSSPRCGTCTSRPLVVGFASSWLAFSGLESISQIAPALREPRERTALRAMMLVVACILITSPLMTAFETALLNVQRVNPEQFVFVLGAEFGPRGAPARDRVDRLHVAHGRGQHGDHRLLPCVPGPGAPRVPAAWLAERSRRFNTPHRAIVISVLVPIAVIIASRGHTILLGHLYAFGLLGAFSLTSVGLDCIRWQERKRSLIFFARPPDLGPRGGRLVYQPGSQDVGDDLRRLGDRDRSGGRLRRSPRLPRRREEGLSHARGGGTGGRAAAGCRRDPHGRRGARHAGGLPVEHPGGDASAEPAPVSGGRCPRARLG